MPHQPAPHYPSAVPYYDWAAHHAARAPGKLALVDVATARRFTYADLHQRADHLAGWLAAQGVGQGDRVAIL